MPDARLAFGGATVDDYARLIGDLLPRGWAWPRDGGVLADVMEAMAVELWRHHRRAEDLLFRESVPPSAAELLGAWERVLGLPDACFGASDILAERRDRVAARLIEVGDQSRAYFAVIAASIGYAITITEFRPFRAGVSRAGDAAYGANWLLAWRINAPAVTVRTFRAGGGAAGEPLRSWGNELLECVIRRIAAAHTTVFFGYGEG